MWRWPDYKEAVAWLKANAQGPTGLYLWGTIYVKRAEWDGSGWRWLTEEEQRHADRHSPKPTLKTRWTLVRWYVHAFFYRLIRRWM